jgi:nicotinate-nucleotide pyrophosphorylase (carboxylating)
MNAFALTALLPQIRQWLEEDDLTKNFSYSKALPDHPVRPVLKIKSPLVLCGVDYFTAVFVALGCRPEDFEFLQHWDGKHFSAGEVIEFTETIPFNVALTGERLALNLLQHGSSIATWTKAHVEKAAGTSVKILDTRKTTPGLRSLEKYAVRVGGGHNHRFGQADTWMIKDNHKTCLGGLKGAWAFFEKVGSFYNNTVVEIHDFEEFKEAIALGVNHVMLDNFDRAQIEQAVKLKKPGMTIEVSGGIRLDNLEHYLIDGVDAISLGSVIYSAPRVDLSLKFRNV